MGVFGGQKQNIKPTLTNTDGSRSFLVRRVFQAKCDKGITHRMWTYDRAKLLILINNKHNSIEKQGKDRQK